MSFEIFGKVSYGIGPNSWIRTVEHSKRVIDIGIFLINQAHRV